MPRSFTTAEQARVDRATIEGSCLGCGHNGQRVTFSFEQDGDVVWNGTCTYTTPPSYTGLSRQLLIAEHACAHELAARFISPAAQERACIRHKPR